MPIGTESPNVYPCDFRLRRALYDDDNDQMEINPDGSINTVGSANSLDAFYRQRVGTPHTIFDSKQIGDNQPLFYDDQEVSGGGTTRR